MLISVFDGNDVKVLQKRTEYDGFFRLEHLELKHSLFAGGWSAIVKRELLVRGRAVGVLLFDPIHDQVVLVEQFRVGALNAPSSPWLIEVVAGMVESGESLEEVAQRETYEEAGLKLQDNELIKICDYYVSPGGSDEQMTLFCAKVDASQAKGIHGLDKEHEDIRVVVFSMSEIKHSLRDGKVNNATTLIALQWLCLNNERIKRLWLES